MQPTRDSPPNFTNSSSSSISKTNLIKMWAEDLSRNFSKAKTQTAKRHTRRLSTSRIPREVQIKTTMSLCITPVGMVIVKNSTNNIQSNLPFSEGACLILEISSLLLHLPPQGMGFVLLPLILLLPS